jgi:hypothetical protein
MIVDVVHTVRNNQTCRRSRVVRSQTHTLTVHSPAFYRMMHSLAHAFRSAACIEVDSKLPQVFEKPAKDRKQYVPLIITFLV